MRIPWISFVPMLGLSYAMKLPQFPFPNPPSKCCSLLSELASPANIPSRISPHEIALRMTPLYAMQLVKHWSSNAIGNPGCIYTPSTAATADDIGHVLSTLLEADCKFAVRSGGHMVVPGHSSPSEGVLVSLAGRDTLELVDGTGKDAGKKLLKVGAGLKWSAVYEFLEPFGLTALGGRTASVGVGGFLLGGGISHLSKVHGLGADNVVEYEVILPNATVAHVNEHSHPDLFWALKGGSNNFGLVVSFTIRTFYVPQIWGGTVQYPMSESHDVLSAISDFHQSSTDPEAAIIPVFITQSGQSWIYLTLFHADGNSTEIPDALQPFLDIPHVTNTLRRTTMKNLGMETNGGPLGLRRFFVTGTLRAHRLSGPLILSSLRSALLGSPFTASPTLNISLDLGTDLHLPKIDVDLPKSLDISLPPIATPDLAVMVTLQILPKAILDKGEHSFGLDADDGPYIAYFALTETALPRDVQLTKMLNDFHENVQKTAARYSTAYHLSPPLPHPFTYINDCGYQVFENGTVTLQDGIASYSSPNLKRLQIIRDLYDPNGRWARLVGGWRIPAN